MDTLDADRSYITSRWLEYEGELRAGILRVLLIISFYSVQLYQYFSTERNQTLELFHRQVTYLSAIWLLVSLGALVAIGRQWLPAGLKYAVSAMDIGLLSAAVRFGSGAASPLACLYLLLVMMAGLRGSLKLIWFTTVLSLLAYIWVWLFGTVWAHPSLTQPVKPIAVMVVGLGIVASGLVTGQVVRMIRQVVAEVCSQQRLPKSEQAQGADA